MSKLTYVGGLCFLGACILGALILLAIVLLGVIGLQGDRPTSLRVLVEMLLVGGIFLAAWTAAYRLSNRKPSKPEPDQ